MFHLSVHGAVFLGAALACSAFALASIAAVVRGCMPGTGGRLAAVMREVVPARRAET